MQRSDGAVLVSPRHWDSVCHEMVRVSADPDAWKDSVQGFVDQRGVFLNRREAWVVAEAAGQIKRRVGGDTAGGGRLYSENLY